MPEARMRATVQLRENPAQNAQIVESLGAGALVEILEDQGVWLKATPAVSGHAHPIPGWALREAFAFPPNGNAFPLVNLTDGKSYAPIPDSLKANDLLAWNNAAGDDPAWIPAPVWNKISPGDRQTAKDGIRAALQTHQAEWNAWQAAVSAEGRQADASLGEWLAALQNGRDVWSVRPEMIYAEASQAQGHRGWVKESDIMRWTGKVKRNDHEPKYKTWYEVSLYKADKMLKGWFKGDLIEPYVYPSQSNDPAIDANRETQFDLTTPILRHPDDPEIQDAIAAKRTGYQYLDIVNALGKTKIHYNLCGEFCAAALAGVDVIPLLNQWKAVYPAALNIMRNNDGTGLGDIKSILSMYNLTFEEFRYTPSVTPVSPARLLALLEQGKKIFWGVAIFKANGKLSGAVFNDTTTRHWIVLEDVIPVGNGGWMRIYNPFRNREEVYLYEHFIQSVGQFGIGLLVDA